MTYREERERKRERGRENDAKKEVGVGVGRGINEVMFSSLLTLMFEENGSLCGPISEAAYALNMFPYATQFGRSE